jgi:hypothetical protein
VSRRCCSCQQQPGPSTPHHSNDQAGQVWFKSIRSNFHGQPSETRPPLSLLNPQHPSPPTPQPPSHQLEAASVLQPSSSSMSQHPLSPAIHVRGMSQAPDPHHPV